MSAWITPPLFVLADQNFPPIVPVGGEGECIKIVQVENGSLAELVEVFLGLTRGFDLPAGTVLLLSSASHAAFVGTADYAADFIRASGQLRNAFMGGGSLSYTVSPSLSVAQSTHLQLGQWRSGALGPHHSYRY